MPSASDALAEIVDRLDLDEAAKRLSRNDLLPRRLEDKTIGQLRAGWIAELQYRLKAGTYVPSAAVVVPVPKSRFSTRPAALLTFQDRIVFEALSHSIAAKVERQILDTATVYWPRGTTCGTRWQEFEKQALKTLSGEESTHVVKGDISGFYESIDHDGLKSLIVKATASTEMANAIVLFLEVVMKRRRGLPQGADASDRLSSLYLSPVDAEIAAFGANYVRHGDDIRVGCESFEQAAECTHLIERALRDQGLLPNTSKVAILRATTYSQEVAPPETRADAIQEAWIEAATRNALESDDDEALLGLIAHADLDELGWQWYHGIAEPEEIIEQIRPHLTLDQQTIATRMFINAMTLRPGGGKDKALSNEEFHLRIQFSLRILTAAKNPFAIDDCGIVLEYHPDKTQLVCEYLSSCFILQETRTYDALKRCCVPEYMLGWQRAWMFQTIRLVAEELSSADVEFVTSVATSDKFGWLERVAAAQLLAKRADLQRSTYSHLWSSAPNAFRSELIAAAHLMRGEEWAIKAIGAANGDAVLTAVVSNLENSDFE